MQAQKALFGVLQFGGRSGFETAASVPAATRVYPIEQKVMSLFNSSCSGK
jgi:hypothetical protein